MANMNIYDMTDTWSSGSTTYAALKMNVTDNGSASDSKILQLQIGSSDKLVLAKSGNVGIGTSSPTAILHVYGKDAVINTLNVGTGSEYRSTVVGAQALKSVTTGHSNSVFGYMALQANTTGQQNTGLGYQTLYWNTQGNYNTAIGWAALDYNTTGYQNTGIGWGALYGSAFNTSYNNTATGYNALGGINDCHDNTANGYNALSTNNTGNLNAAFGSRALVNNKGSNNTGLGANAGNAITTGNNHVIVGGFSGNAQGLDIRTTSGYVVLSDGLGSIRQVIDANGNVGIGTSAPTNTLSVYGGNVQIGTSGKGIVFPDGSTLTTVGGYSTQITVTGATSVTLPTTGNIMSANQTANITAGYTFTPYNAGTQSSGTFTPNPVNGNYQYYTNNGAHILAAPTTDCAINIQIANGATAGNITFSGYTVGSYTGDSLTTTNGNVFLINIIRMNGISTYMIRAYQ